MGYELIDGPSDFSDQDDKLEKGEETAIKRHRTRCECQ